MSSLEVTERLWIFKTTFGFYWSYLIGSQNEISELEEYRCRYHISLHSDQHGQWTTMSFQVIHLSFLRKNSFAFPYIIFLSLLTFANMTELRELIVLGGFESLWDFWLIKFKFKASPLLLPNSCLVDFVLWELWSWIVRKWAFLNVAAFNHLV